MGSICDSGHEAEHVKNSSVHETYLKKNKENTTAKQIHIKDISIASSATTSSVVSNTNRTYDYHSHASKPRHIHRTKNDTVILTEQATPDIVGSLSSTRGRRYSARADENIPYFPQKPTKDAFQQEDDFLPPNAKNDTLKRRIAKQEIKIFQSRAEEQKPMYCMSYSSGVDSSSSDSDSSSSSSLNINFFQTSVLSDDEIALEHNFALKREIERLENVYKLMKQTLKRGDPLTAEFEKLKKKQLLSKLNTSESMMDEMDIDDSKTTLDDHSNKMSKKRALFAKKLEKRREIQNARKKQIQDAINISKEMTNKNLLDFLSNSMMNKEIENNQRQRHLSYIQQQKNHKKDQPTIKKIVISSLEDKKQNTTIMMDDEMSSSESDTNDNEYEDGEWTFDDFKIGLINIDIDINVLPVTEVKILWKYISDGDQTINTQDFCYFLCTKAFNLDFQLVSIQQKILKCVLAKTQTYPTLKNRSTNEMIDDDTNAVENVGKQSSVDRVQMKIKQRQQQMQERKSALPIKEVATEHVPNESFNHLNYNWEDTITNQSFNNYRRLRQTFTLKFGKKKRKRSRGKKHRTHSSETFNSANTANTFDTQVKREHKLNKLMHRKVDTNTENIELSSVLKILNNRTVSEIEEKTQIEYEIKIEESKNDRDLTTISETIVDNRDHNKLKNSYLKNKKRLSVRQSLETIENYEGDKNMRQLRKLYKRQHKMKRKLDRLRTKNLLKFPAPSKPNEEMIDEMLVSNDTIQKLLIECRECFCKYSRYTGLCNFGKNGELGIEFECISDIYEDENGYFTGKRVTSFRGSKTVEGKGRIWADVMWNGNEYVPCARFQWIDDSNGVTTKLECNSFQHNFDISHSFFEGKCQRWPSHLDPNEQTTKLVMHEGFFDFICMSSRRRKEQRASFLANAMNLDLSEMTEEEIRNIPKYMRRASQLTDKIAEFYEADAKQQTHQELFGDAIKTVETAVKNLKRRSESQGGS